MKCINCLRTGESLKGDSPVMRTLIKKLCVRELIREHRKTKTTTTFALYFNAEILLRHTLRLIRPRVTTETLLL